MRKQLADIVCLFVFCALLFDANAQKDSLESVRKLPHGNFRFYPLSLFGGQMPQYCSEFTVGSEFFFKKRHGIQVNAGVVYPNPITGFVQFVWTTSENADSPYWLYGGRGSLGYKCFLMKGKPKDYPGLYLGFEISGCYIQSTSRLEQNNEDGYFNDWSTRSITKAVMTNYNFTAGYQIYSKRVFVDIAAGVGYRYHYFWRLYRNGTVAEYWRNGLYGFYRKVPIGLSFTIAVGGLF